ncbi:MAG: peptidoglycan binding domain-containing protein [Eubacteriales bacterium]|nr:peptidoglycan binding domain-containing protein [Eubacteriales bacterium]
MEEGRRRRRREAQPQKQSIERKQLLAKAQKQVQKQMQKQQSKAAQRQQNKAAVPKPAKAAQTKQAQARQNRQTAAQQNAVQQNGRVRRRQVEQQTQMLRRQQSDRLYGILKKAGIAAGVVLAAIYVGISIYYSGHFMKGSYMNGVDISGMTAEEAKEQAREQMAAYTLTIHARELGDEVIGGSSIDYVYQENDNVSKQLSSQLSFLWIFRSLFPGNHPVEIDTSYDNALLSQRLQTLSAFSEESQRAPVDAHIEFGKEGFEVVPEDEGTTLKADEAIQLIREALDLGLREVDLDESGVYETVTVRQDDPSLMEKIKPYTEYANASVTYLMGNERVVLDGNTLKDWLTVDADGNLTRDDEVFKQKLQTYVEVFASKYDTIDTYRTMTSTNGERKTAYAYEYGWQVDQEAELAQLTEEILGGKFVEREPNYSSTAHGHGENDLGNSYIEVDLGYQHMYYYMDGQMVFESAFISGKPDGEHDTHVGIFKIHNMESPSVLTGEMRTDGTPEYQTTVQYWIAFDGGIGFHDATWQTMGFGGDLYLSVGSHGCINLPLDAAAELYSIIRWEDPVVVIQ